MKKKIIWKILLGLGCISFVVVLICGLVAAIGGFSGVCWWMCENYDYGFSAFVDSIILYSYIFWPTYIIGFFLIILSIFKLKKNK